MPLPYLDKLKAIISDEPGDPPSRQASLVEGATDLIEEIVRRTIFDAVEPAGWSVDAAWEVLCPVALGSFGRRDMTVYSDVDLMFLLDPGRVEDDEVLELIDRSLYGLWDLGFTVGHAVRTPDQALTLAAEDPKVLTSLLEARALPSKAETQPAEAGRLAQLVERVDAYLARPEVASAFIEAKLQEARERRARYGDTVYLLEPNVKEGRGGLRDLHTAWWIARARWRVPPDELLLLGVLSGVEERSIERAYEFLLRVRAEMHMADGRRNDALRFDLQEHLAESLGFGTDHDHTPHRRRTTERFMRAYYFHAGQITLFSRLLIERATSHRRRPAIRSRAAPGGFKTWNDTLTVAHRDQFSRDPAALVRIFRVAQDEAMEIYSYTKDLVRASRRLMDAGFRRRADVVEEFLAIIEDPKADGEILSEMHDLGVLKGMIPEFARVTARWQHSLYHVYTVDVHSIRVLRNLKQLRTGRFADSQPDLTRWMADVERSNVLYLGGLLHDVGKGWPNDDHSIRGERVARAVGARLEAAGIDAWTSEDTRDLAWLVRDHLLMSDLAQRRDVTDPELIAEFAAACGTLERLRMLYILTFADMLGTSPKVWTTWKGTLLGQLYRGTARLLTEQEPAAPEDRERLRRRLTRELQVEAAARPDLAVSPDEVEEFVSLAPSRYLLGFNPRRMVRHVEMWRSVSRLGGLAVHTSHLRREGTTRLTVVGPDQPGHLALLAGTLAANGLQIASAQGFSVSRASVPQIVIPENDTGAESGTYELISADDEQLAGRLLVDVVYATDEQGRLCDDNRRWAQFRRDLEDVMLNGADLNELFDARRPAPTITPRARPVVDIEVRVENEETAAETVIDVFGPDGLGALYRIAQALADEGLEIQLAKISTQGDRIADAFYVVDSETQAKIEDPQRQTSIRRAINAAFAVIGDRPRSLAQIV